MERRVALTLKHAGVSITVTSLTDTAAFLIGSTTVRYGEILVGALLSAKCIWAFEHGELTGHVVFPEFAHPPLVLRVRGLRRPLPLLFCRHLLCWVKKIFII